ncbi:hypothetical protein PAECIP111890_04524 [Paenibacillus sp. JJ-223]|nr:hypothetical protein PAECIP111890_04524 [Paenibacillus sp. JJ-223]
MCRVTATRHISSFLMRANEPQPPYMVDFMLLDG